MKPGWLRFAYLKHLSHPAQDRPLYRLLDGGKIKTISEIGIGCGIRMRRMMEIVLHRHSPEEIRYAGFDLFESSAPGRACLTLKQAHRELVALGLHPRLVPGDLASGLLRTANTLPQTDLIVISGMDHALLESAWFYFPRMLHENSLVMIESGNVRPEFQALNLQQVKELARRSASSVRRAA